MMVLLYILFAGFVAFVLIVFASTLLGMHIDRGINKYIDLKEEQYKRLSHYDVDLSPDKKNVC